MTPPLAQAEAVRANAGLFLRDDRGRIEARGGDRVRWLNGMVSNDIATLEPGAERSGCYALLLTPKARIVADFHVFSREASLWLDVAAEAREEAQARLEARIIADDVELSDTTPEWRVIDLWGPRAFDWLARTAEPPALAPNACVAFELAGVEVWGARVGIAFDVARLFVPAAEAAAVHAALAASADGAVVNGSAETLEALRIEAGEPRLGPDFGEAAFPEEAGLVARAVSLTKGCYTGQEIVARIDSRGQVKRKLVPLRFEAAAPAPGSALERDGDAVGEVTSAAATPSGARGLGYVRLPHDAPGTRLVVGAQQATVIAPGS